MKTVPISEIASDLYSAGNYFNISLDGVTYVTGLDFINLFLQRFYDWTYIYWNASLTPVDAFKDSWITYLAASADEIQHIIQAITAEYDVTTNYSRTITTASKNTHTTDHGKTTTETPNNYTTTTTYGGTRSDNTTTFDSIAYRADGQSVNSGSDTVTTSGSLTTSNTGTDTVTDTRLAADNVVSETGINSTPTESVEKEIALRIKYDLCNIVMYGFVRECCFLEV